MNHYSAYFHLLPELPIKTFSRLFRKSIVSICRLRFNLSCLPTNLTRFISVVFMYCTFHSDPNILTTSNNIFFQRSQLTSLIKNFQELLLFSNSPRLWSIPSLLASPSPLVCVGIAQFINNYLPSPKSKTQASPFLPLHSSK